jgi:hypothetical protein
MQCYPGPWYSTLSCKLPRKTINHEVVAERNIRFASREMTWISTYLLQLAKGGKSLLHMFWLTLSATVVCICRG